MSVVTPVMALLPVFNVGTSFLLLGEVPSVFGWLGILLIVFGTYLMLWKKSKTKNIAIPVLLMIGAMFCIAIGSTLDKVSIQVSNPVFYGFMNTLGASVVFLILMYFYKEKNSFTEMKSRFWVLTFLGIIQAVSFVSYMYAFKYGQTSYVLAIRAGAYVLAGLYGIFFLKEVVTRRKIIAIICFLIGVLALAFA